MNFDFSDEQKALGDMVSRFLREHESLRGARTLLDHGGSHDTALWSVVGEAGWCGIVVPETYGGAGFSHLELCLMAEQMGRALAPLPFGPTVYVAVETLLRNGSEDQKQGWLPRLAQGQAVGALAFSEGGEILPAQIQTRVQGGRLTGRKAAVVDGAIADVAIVSAMDGETQRIFLADLGQSGVTRSAAPSVDPSRPCAALSFDAVPVEPLHGSDNSAVAANDVLDRAAVLFAFEQLGLAEACIELAVEYALSRRTFGRAIGTYQAIKHKLADIFVEVQLARANAYFAAWALDSGSDQLPEAAALARVSATAASLLASRELIQVFGGAGFTWEMDCHLYYRRAKHLSLILGSELGWQDRLGRQALQRLAA